MALQDRGAVSGEGTRSRSDIETVNGSHHFTIKGYSLSKGMGIGKYIASESFTVGGHQFAIYFYPDGKNEEDNSLGYKRFYRREILEASDYLKNDTLSFTCKVGVVVTSTQGLGE